MDENITLSIKAGLSWLMDYYETYAGVLPPDIKSRFMELEIKARHEEILKTKEFHPDLDKFRKQYQEQIKKSLEQTDNNSARIGFLLAMVAAFNNAFLSGWVDAGAPLPVTPEASQYLVKKEEQEKEYILALLAALVLLRQREDFDFEDWLQARLEGYLGGMNGVYNVGKMFGISESKPNELFTMAGEDGYESCDTCQRLKKEHHPARWWIDNNFIPYPGNDSLDCHGWRCQHYITNMRGDQLTVSLKSFIHLTPTPPEIANDPAKANANALKEHNPRIAVYAKGKDIYTGAEIIAYVVDGRWIRDSIWTDFTAAGNSERYYPWLPSNEIWLDIANFKEWDINLIHESIEAYEMREEHLDYPIAHSNYANDSEYIARKNPEKITEMLRALGWTL